MALEELETFRDLLAESGADATALAEIEAWIEEAACTVRERFVDRDSGTVGTLLGVATSLGLGAMQVNSGLAAFTAVGAGFG